jgi:hypothetical protein
MGFSRENKPRSAAAANPFDDPQAQEVRKPLSEIARKRLLILDGIKQSRSLVPNVARRSSPIF